MITLLPFRCGAVMEELIIDSFVGGGESEGIKLALGRFPDIALLWAFPDCKRFSKARRQVGKRNIHDYAWVMVRSAARRSAARCLAGRQTANQIIWTSRSPMDLRRRQPYHNR